MNEKDSAGQFPILIVEDDPVSRTILERTLVNSGYKVMSVENGRRALDVFSEKFFPIVLTDWVMPEMDGLQLCRAIRQKNCEGYVFIILLTGKDSKKDIIAGLHAGADDYLTKPFNHIELIARLNSGKRILELERSLKKANETIWFMSITDPLTGGYNRGYLTERLPKEVMRARRYAHSLSVVFCDIDHFKKVNDTYGHQVGDEVLKKFVGIIHESIRHDVDWLARYGGEEFLIVLPETKVEDATCMAERLRRTISQRVFQCQGIEICITASFGITGFCPATPEKNISYEAMIKKADKCMYQAKQEGRDRLKACPL